MIKRILVIGLVVILFVIVFGIWKFSRFGYETAEYQTLSKQGRFEVRQYSPMTIASTSMDNSNPNSGGTFSRLFRYIAKDNQAEQKIAMTTPVFMNEKDETGEMSFVVPKNVAEAGAPAPKSEQVNVKQWAPGKVAVYRYSGSWDSDAKQAALAKLRQWLVEQSLTPTPDADEFSAGYDPPFTPPFLRRNEVFIPVL